MSTSVSAIITGSNVLVPLTYQSEDYIATIHDHVIICGVSSGSLTITIPDTSNIPSGLVLVIKDDGSATSSNKIIISSDSNIDGSPESIEIQTGKGSRTLVSENGIGWYIIGSYTAPS